MILSALAALHLASPLQVSRFHNARLTRQFSSLLRSSPTPSQSLSADAQTRTHKNARLTRQFSSLLRSSPTPSQSLPADAQSPLINLQTITADELTTILTSWKEPKFRSKQILTWIRSEGVTDVNKMTNLPITLREKLLLYSTPGSLELVSNLISNRDGTVKRAYRLKDGPVIESVLMKYADGRNTACISSQAGCAMGCVFCATGQMGLKRQLNSDEIFEQVARFSTELLAAGEGQRLSNVVFMGMGEPLMNYKNVMTAVDRICDELGIGASKITVSTVGVVPNIRKLILHPRQVRLAVSLHESDNASRSQLIPANKRFGGLSELMASVSEYTQATNRRITFEWALIKDENDNVDTARNLGELIQSYEIPPYLVHINVIPLNPTKYRGNASNKSAVDAFCNVLKNEFKISCTPRMRRGIDIEAGCGQLATDLSAE